MTNPAALNLEQPAQAQVTPQQVGDEIQEMKRELNKLALGMAHVARELEPVEKEYEKFVDDFEIGLWTKHVENGDKLPSEKLRRQLAHRAMPPELYGRYFALVHSRDRMVKRVSSLKVTINAAQSLLGAMKEGLIV
jgi:hypothetical protein